MRTKRGKLITASEMRLADVVRPGWEGEHGYIDHTVKNIKDGLVTLLRPYVHTEDFSYTGGVPCYLGWEEYQISATNNGKWLLLDRKTLK